LRLQAIAQNNANSSTKLVCDLEMEIYGKSIVNNFTSVAAN